MSNEMFHVAMAILIGLFIFWLLYRIKMRLTKLMTNKIVQELPSLLGQIENFKKTLDYLTSRTELLERRLDALENKAKE